MSKFKVYGQVFVQLLLTDLTILKQVIWDKLINLCIWVSSIALVFTYLMPLLGLGGTFSSFMLAGLCASAGLFDVFPSAVNFVSDLEGDQIISFYCTLPIPTWLVLMRSIIYYSINSAILMACVLPIGKILMWYHFDMSTIQFGKFAIMFVLTSLFYGAFTLMVASRVRKMEKIGNIWMRMVYPLWYVGCFQFSWYVLYNAFPSFAYFDLLNPLTYIMEGNRAAILGDDGYLPFCISVSVLLLFVALFMWQGIRSIKRRLDFV